jgi:hypothetical protein
MSHPFHAQCIDGSSSSVIPDGTSMATNAAVAQRRPRLHLIAAHLQSSLEYSVRVIPYRYCIQALTVRTGYSPPSSRFDPAGNPASPRRRCPRH